MLETPSAEGPTTDDVGGALASLAVHIAFDAGHVIVSVRGDLDAESTPTLAAILAALVPAGHITIVLDLAAVAFMGAAGLGMIASFGERIRAIGGALTMREPSARTRRVLDLTGVSPRVLIEDRDAPAGLVADLALVAWHPTRDDITDANLLNVVTLASLAIDGADGASISLARHGRLSTVAASNDTVLRMDDHQYETGEGPCVAAAADGQRRESTALDRERRWPSFVPLAMSDGVASILSTPLLDGDRPIGAFNMYSSTNGAFGTEAHDLAGVFATYAAEIVSQADENVTAEAITARIDDALRSRAVLAMAQGILMARAGLTSEQATTVLHRVARGAGLTTLEQAADIVASTIQQHRPAHDHG